MALSLHSGGMEISPLKNIHQAWLLLAAALLLTGCGGGSAVTPTAGSSQVTGSIIRSTGSAASTSSPPPPSTSASFSLSWAAPATRADGTPLSLSDIDGYRVYYGTRRGSYPNKVDITNGAATSKVINNLAPGKKYYLVMTTYDQAGRESAPSPEIAKTAI